MEAQNSTGNNNTTAFLREADLDKNYIIDGVFLLVAKFIEKNKEWLSSFISDNEQGTTEFKEKFKNQLKEFEATAKTLVDNEKLLYTLGMPLFNGNIEFSKLYCILRDNYGYKGTENIEQEGNGFNLCAAALPQINTNNIYETIKFYFVLGIFRTGKVAYFDKEYSKNPLKLAWHCLWGNMYTGIISPNLENKLGPESVKKLMNETEAPNFLGFFPKKYDLANRQNELNSVEDAVNFGKREFFGLQ